MAMKTFTVRLGPREHELLIELAHAWRQSIGALSREMLAEGIRRQLNPEEIERRHSAERERLRELE